MPDDSPHNPVTDESAPPPEPSPDIRPLYHSDAVRQAELALFNATARSTLNAVFATPIEGRHISFTGSVPFAQEHLEQWVETLGAFATPDRLDDTIADWFVLGRVNFENSYLESIVACDIRVFSQEEFLSLLLFGEAATARNRIDAADNPHPGLEWFEGLEQTFDDDMKALLDSLAPGEGELTEPGQPLAPPLTPALDPDDPPNWSIIPEETSNESYDGAVHLKVESELRRLGYSVAKRVPLARRHYCLDLCVQRLGLTKVVNHLRWLIYFQRKNPQQQQAVANWRYDLEWLRSRHGT
jgi:hypothetical protein